MSSSVVGKHMAPKTRESPLGGIVQHTLQLLRHTQTGSEYHTCYMYHAFTVARDAQARA